MPFGLKNAPAHFQRMRALKDCREVSSPYIDDVLIFSKEPKEHPQHVKTVLLALRQAGLTAKPSKCEWGREYLTYLGHRIGRGKVAVPEARALDYRKSRTQKETRAFLGAIKALRSYLAFSPRLPPPKLQS